ncbi:hypothetical protein MKW92_015445, partial [Papaver armeniacum]
MVSSYSTNDDGFTYFDFPAAPAPYWNTLGATSLFQYFIVLNIDSQGTPPPNEYILVIHTEADLTWIQCLPCKERYNQVAPIFDPTKSPTFKVKSCAHYRFCTGPNGGCNDRGECTYSIVTVTIYTRGNNCGRY